MQKKQSASLPKRLLAGLPAAGVFWLLCLLISMILLKKNVAADLFFPLLLGSAGVSGLIGGFSAAAKERKQGLLNGSLAAVLPILSYLAAVTALNRSFRVGSLLPCLVLLAASVAAGIAAANRKQKMKIKKRK